MPVHDAGNSVTPGGRCCISLKLPRAEVSTSPVAASPSGETLDCLGEDWAVAEFLMTKTFHSLGLRFESPGKMFVSALMVEVGSIPLHWWRWWRLNARSHLR